MALILSLPDDIVLNFVLLFVGDVKELLNLRTVSKKLNEKIEILLLAIVELDLIQIEKIRNTELYSSNRKLLENFFDLKHMLETNLWKLSWNKLIDSFDYFVGQGLIILARNWDVEASLEDLEYFYENTMIDELLNVFLFKSNKNIIKKAEEQCLKAWATNVIINDNQRNMLNWLSGALEISKTAEKLQPGLEQLIEMRSKIDFYKKRGVLLSKFFGFSIENVFEGV